MCDFKNTCDDYDEGCDKINNRPITGCYIEKPLMAKIEPVAEVPCSDRVISPATELLKAVATEFFYWWYNQPGTNTADGFDDWWKINHSRFGL